MATEATFRIPVDQFPLGSLFQQCPEATVELERVVPTGDQAVPYVWIHGTAIANSDALVEDQPGIISIEHIDSVVDDHLYRIQWDLSHDGLLKHLGECELILTEAVGTNDHWTFTVRSETRNALSRFETACRRNDIPIAITKLNAITPVDSPTATLLTDPQREALVVAYNRGYFESPRGATLEEIGAELGISQQAVADRLRRGLDQIVELTVIGANH